jgi:hypothetical protein
VTIAEFEAYVERLGYTVEPIDGADGPYLAIRDIAITTGALAGRTCDVAIRRDRTLPYIPPAAIHTRPALVPMGTLNTQASPVGADWQYWSRRFDRAVTPVNLWAHILTVLSEVR